MRRLLLGLGVVMGSVLGCVDGGGEPTVGERVVHVSPDGDDDAGDGSSAHPWSTLQHAVDHLEPGMTLEVHAGVYTGPLRIGVSGSEDEGWIVIRAHGDDRPVIDGTGVEIGDGFFPLVGIHSRSWIRFQGFEIRNAVSTSPGNSPVGIFVSGSGSHIELLDNDVHTIETRVETGSSDAHGIAVYGTADEPLTEVVIRGNEVHDLLLGTSEAVVVNGNVDGFTIEANHVHHTDNIGIDIIGFEGKAPTPELDRARNGTVVDNLVNDVDGLDNPAYRERNAGGIYVDGGRDVLIEGNEVHHANIGIEIASEHRGGDTSRVVVRGNDLHDNHLTGLAMGGYDELRGRTEDCEISGNTFTGNDTDGVGWGELFIQFDVRGNTITGNTFTAGPAGRFITNPWVENEGSVVDDNTYVASGGETVWEWRTTTYRDFDGYRAATGNDASSELVTDPAG